MFGLKSGRVKAEQRAASRGEVAGATQEEPAPVNNTPAKMAATAAMSILPVGLHNSDFPELDSSERVFYVSSRRRQNRHRRINSQIPA